MNLRRACVRAFAASVVFAVHAYAGAIQNNKFLDGLDGWTESGGNAVVFPGALGPFATTGANNFALITTGPGDLGDDEGDNSSLLSAPFVAVSGDFLSFRVLFLTSEFTGSLSDPDRLDWFYVDLLNTTTNVQDRLLSGNVADLDFAGIPDAPLSAPDASTFFESKELRYRALLSPGEYRLLFAVGDMGDNNFDSGLLIDDLHLMGVPEPSTQFTACTALAAMVVAALHRRVRRH